VSSDLGKVESTGTSFSSAHLPTDLDVETVGYTKFVLLGLVILLFTFEEPRLGSARKKAETVGLAEPAKQILLAKCRAEAERRLGSPVTFSDEKYEFVAHIRFVSPLYSSKAKREWTELTKVCAAREKNDFRAFFFEGLEFKRDSVVLKDAVIEGRMGLVGSSESKSGLLKFEIEVDGLNSAHPKFSPKNIVLEVSDSEKVDRIPIV